MKRFQLARRWWPLALCSAAFVGAELWLYLGVTRYAVEAWRAGGSPPGQWSWVSICGWHLLLAAAGVFVASGPLAELRTVFTAEGVRRPRLLGRPVFVRWAEAESVFVAPHAGRPQRVRIQAPGRAVELNALFYRDTSALLALIEERMRAFSA